MSTRPSAAYINRRAFPNGWNDSLDADAYHWIIEDKGQLVASCRLCILTDLQQMEENFQQFKLPDGPHAFYSRLVVAKAYRGKGLGRKMDLVRLNFIRCQQIVSILAWARNDRLLSLNKFGFKSLGALTIEYPNQKEIATALHLDYRNNLLRE
ncbi:MAG: GNAT family N-acetyltransferase [Bacteroidota bacterium]